MNKQIHYHICTRCDANWGIEEYSFQECDSCGYPNHYDDDDNEELDIDEYCQIYNDNNK